MICAEILEKFQSYPEPIAEKLLHLRQLIIATAAETDGIEELAETLKWNQPSYVTKEGSTIRLGWRTAYPDQYAIFFHCQTKLVDTFKQLYPDKFHFEGNRAIVFHQNEVIATAALQHCIVLALTYHKIKHLPMLGA